MPYPKSVRSFSLLLLLVSPVASAAREFNAWQEFDLDHPVCERPISLAVGRETFFEIANEVAGRADYNHLVRLFKERDWTEFHKAMENFWKKHENSPLREAATFLEVQSLFDQDRPFVDEQERGAERKLRNALLLYPKSEFAPALAATAGAHWLRTHNYQRALAVYEIAATSYPGHSLYCTYLTGIAETHFMLRKWDDASKAFRMVVEGCKGFRLRAAAQLRQIDVDALQGKPGVEARYERLLALENPFVERFFQPTLANMGEMKYRAGKYEEAGHFFQRYLTTERTEDGCQAMVMKRLADVAARENKPAGTVIGRYLAVHEKFPLTDVGRFAYVHALLADPALQPGGELERRIRLVDAEMDLIGSEDLRSRAYLEKGLTLLDLGQSSALSYLNKLRVQTRYAMDKGKTGSFIRGKIRGLLSDGKMVALDSPSIENAILQVYQDWLKGTPDADWARQFYGRNAADRFAALVAKGAIREAVDILERWKTSPLWSDKVENTVRWKIGDALTQALLAGGPDSETALMVQQSAGTLAPFVKSDFPVVPWFAAILLGSKETPKAPSDPSSQLPSAMRARYKLALAQGLRLTGRAEAGGRSIASVQEPTLASDLTRERVEIAKARKEGKTAFGLLKKEWTTADAARKKDLLKQMAEVVEQTKTWSVGAELMDTARQTVSDPMELGVYYHQAARAMFENKQCKQAIPVFENAFRMNPGAPQTAASRFRLGRCWLNEKRPEAARQEWQKVVALKDSFWSPLAKSEIQLLSP